MTHQKLHDLQSNGNILKNNNAHIFNYGHYKNVKYYMIN